MTAEIAIMNKSAVALAADSAVTFNVDGEQKVYQTVNKLFSLSKYQPVGLMVYGSAEFMGIDWETIVKMYRNRLSDRSFSTVRKYSEDFIRFLESTREISDEASQTKFVRQRIGSTFSSIRDEILQSVARKLKRSKATRSDIGHEIQNVVQRHLDWLLELEEITLANGKPIGSTKINDVRSAYQGEVDGIATMVFEDLPVDEETSRKLQDIALYSLIKDNEAGHGSGVVVAGYGTKQIFPALEAMRVDGVFGDILKFRSLQRSAIGRDEPAAIMPFAQSEMVVAFMEGADPEYQNQISAKVRAMLDGYSSALLGIVFPTGVQELHLESIRNLNSELASDFQHDMSNYRQERFVQPVVRIVEGLPKSDLAAMAESLVNLTSFRRHVTPDAETVGGPIDVAVISRGDGFVWIKRKHYFQPDLNPHFFRNYFRGENNGKAENG